MIDLDGAIDLHVHSAPDVYPRSLDDLQLARAAEAEGMAGILLKSHHTLTADRAALVQPLVGIAVRGGLALNLPVGGLNPVAVETAIEFGAQQIWMPTLHARQALHAGTADMFVREVQRGRVGLVAFDEQGAAVDGLLPILELVRDAGVILGTGHLAPDESLRLLAIGRQMGIERMLVTHPMMAFTRFTVPQMQRAVELGAHLEFVALTCRPGWHEAMPAAATAEAIEAVGAAHCVLSSDGGQAANPDAPHMLLAFAKDLEREGVPEGSLRRMLRDNPAYLMGLGDR